MSLVAVMMAMVRARSVIIRLARNLLLFWVASFLRTRKPMIRMMGVRTARLSMINLIAVFMLV